MREVGKKLKRSTVFSYAMACGSGYQIMGTLVGSYLLVFLTDTFGVPAAAAGIIMVIASIWDAINDPIMGIVADRTKTRWGKYRPWFLVVPLLLTVVIVLLFSSPNLSATGKIIWAGVFYILYGMLRTAIEIPSGALINAITDETSQRMRLVSAFTLVMGVFTTITSSFTLAFVSMFGGQNTAKGYMIVVGIAGVLMTLSCWACFATTKEVYVAQKEAAPILEDLKGLLRFKELIPTIIAWLAGFTAFNIMMASSIYYLLYYICRPDLISVYMLDISLVGLIGILVLIPVLMRIFKSIPKAFMVSQIGVCICSLILFFFGKNVAILFLLSGIGSLFATISMPFSSMLMSEMTDYIFYKSGKTMNGTIAALKGFSNKGGIAISSAIISFSLAATGYIAGAIGGQPEAVLLGINASRFIVPAICGVIIVLCMLKYPINDKLRLEMQENNEKNRTSKDS